jgi:hypothetical protein
MSGPITSLFETTKSVFGNMFGNMFETKYKDNCKNPNIVEFVDNLNKILEKSLNEDISEEFTKTISNFLDVCVESPHRADKSRNNIFIRLKNIFNKINTKVLNDMSNIYKKMNELDRPISRKLDYRIVVHVITETETLIMLSEKDVNILKIASLNYSVAEINQCLSNGLDITSVGSHQDRSRSRGSSSSPDRSSEKKYLKYKTKYLKLKKTML